MWIVDSKLLQANLFGFNGLQSKPQILFRLLEPECMPKAHWDFCEHSPEHSCGLQAPAQQEHLPMRGENRGPCKTGRALHCSHPHKASHPWTLSSFGSWPPFGCFTWGRGRERTQITSWWLCSRPGDINHKNVDKELADSQPLYACKCAQSLTVFRVSLKCCLQYHLPAFFPPKNFLCFSCTLHTLRWLYIWSILK